MGKAFQCDLCEYLETGEPIAKVTVPGVNSSNEEWCRDCLASYTDWRATRKPPEPDPDSPCDDEDAVDPGDLPPIQGNYS